MIKTVVIAAVFAIAAGAAGYAIGYNNQPAPERAPYLCAEFEQAPVPYAGFVCSDSIFKN